MGRAPDRQAVAHTVFCSGQKKGVPSKETETGRQAGILVHQISLTQQIMIAR
jgi:hypothetical protein